MKQKAVRIIARGVVQGVGFRAWVADHASQKGCSGWVRNLPSGEVEALIQGIDEDVDWFIDEFEEGPQAASVQEVVTEEITFDDALTTFHVLR